MTLLNISDVVHSETSTCMNIRFSAARNRCNSEEDLAQPDQMHAAAKMPSPRKFTRKFNGSRESRLTESKNQNNRLQQYRHELKHVYQSHRRYVHTLVMTELKMDSESEPRDQKWNAFESMLLFLSDPATQEEM
jgi:hypothetical protein